MKRLVRSRVIGLGTIVEHWVPFAPKGEVMQQGSAVVAVAAPVIWCDDCSGLRWVHVAFEGERSVTACATCAPRVNGHSLRTPEAIAEARRLHARDCGCGAGQ
jgi:hypothetical protein